MARDDEDHGSITYEIERGGFTLAFVPEDTRGKWEHSSAKADATFWASARTDVLRLLATTDAAHRETASLRHATLFAAGVRGGPGAWRWASDPQGTILDDVAAWERLLDEMREATAYREQCNAARARGECLTCGFAPCLCDQQ